MTRYLIKLVFFIFLITSLSYSEESIDFNRDIKPILSDRCFHCHGQDTKNQKSDYRLDVEEEALKDLGGYFGIVPGKPAQSEVVKRIQTHDEDELMPPKKSELSLNDREKGLIIQWIKNGAKYDKHWSFKTIEKPELPKLNKKGQTWVNNEIDHFVYKKLNLHELTPEKEAAPYTLIRRVSLDVRGLPPTRKEVDSYIQDKKPGAYERMLDRMLGDLAYGERMALVWMDAARYADSGGYQNDIKRSQWPWRDWVIKAYQANMPFDQFSIEQLAGDLLPNPSESQRLATAFNRNHRINNEGGIIPEEFLVEYVADRTETTSTVWLGLTSACARCHDHKYDPISQKDYFELFAFFHNVPENGRDGSIAPQPNMVVYENEAYKKKHEEVIQQVEALISGKKKLVQSLQKDKKKWISEQREHSAGSMKLPLPEAHFSFNLPINSKEMNLLTPFQKAIRPRAKNVPVKYVESKFTQGAKVVGRQQVYIGRPFGENPFRSDKAFTLSLWLDVQSKTNDDPIRIIDATLETKAETGLLLELVPSQHKGKFKVQVSLVYDREKDEVYTWLSKSLFQVNQLQLLSLRFYGQQADRMLDVVINNEVNQGEVLRDGLRQSFEVNVPIRLTSEGGGASAVFDDLKIFSQILSAQQIALLYNQHADNLIFSYPTSSVLKDYLNQYYFKFVDNKALKYDKKIKAAKQREEKVASQYKIKVSIMEEMKTPRPTYRLERGLYNQPDKSLRLKPEPFAALPNFSTDLPKNRLGLAKWLFQENHPLTARVAANRLWQMLFGRGIVKTTDDFGAQGSPPSHPELLDWLAWTYMQDWDTKALLKKMLMSATYKQSSRISSGKAKADPENQYLSRGARFRLSGHLLRDQALSLGGLLSRIQGGPPVMPYQPKGLWEEVSAKGYKYIEGKGNDLYRRSLYTFWRRTVPPPSMMNFDSPSRDSCSVNLSVTNTPLQALNLMNDPQYFEASRALAEKMVYSEPQQLGKQIEYGLERVMIEPANQAVVKRLELSYAKYLRYYEQHGGEAKELLSVGQSRPSKDVSESELAAMTMIATTLLNLDAVVNKE